MSMLSSQAAVILTGGISESEFNDAFNNDRIWYAELQPGNGLIDFNETGVDSEFELGGSGSPFFEGNTSIADKSDNPFLINVDSSNFLSVTFNGIGTPGGSQYGISEQFNTIWIGLRLDTGNGAPNTLEVNTHVLDEGVINQEALLPDMYLEEQTSIWTGFKFYKDDDVSNIGDISISGKIHPDMFFGGANDEAWTYTVFATYDPSIVPEPSSFALLIGGLSALFVFIRRRR